VDGLGSEQASSLEGLVAQAREQIAALRRAQERVSELMVPAATSDGLVAVEVGAQGQLRALRLDGAVYERMPPEQLAVVITGLARAAAADAAERARQIMAPVLPGGLRTGQDWGAWLPNAADVASREGGAGW
jgi:DNA-binding protein YbaB